MNGGWLGSDMKNAYQKLVRCTSTDCLTAYMYDRRDGGKVRDAWVYDLHLSDQVMRDGAPTQHIRINVRRDEFKEPKARELAEEAAKSVGRLPFALRWNIDTVTINDGNKPWGGGNKDILIHEGSTPFYRDFWEGNIYDETMVHEAGHTSMDVMIHKGMCEEYEQAVLADGLYISDYATTSPMTCVGTGGHSEDVPESFVVYIGSRLKENGMLPEKRDMYNSAIYSRFAVFDSIMATKTNGVDNFSPYSP